MTGTGAWARLLSDRFRLAARRLGLRSDREVNLRTDLFRAPREGSPQLQLGL
jgi:hypothetical protein